MASGTRPKAGFGAQAPSGPPLLGHIHLPKTAGTSFRRVLNDFYGPGHVDLNFDHDTMFAYQNSELAELVKNPGIKAFTSHFVRRFPAVIAGRPVYYVTFLRDPIQQFLSYITYCRKAYTAIRDPVLLSHLPPGMPELTIRECVRWVLDGPDQDFRNFRENYSTNFYACHNLLDSHGYTYAVPRYQI